MANEPVQSQPFGVRPNHRSPPRLSMPGAPNTVETRKSLRLQAGPLLLGIGLPQPEREAMAEPSLFSSHRQEKVRRLGGQTVESAALDEKRCFAWKAALASSHESC